MTLQVIKANYRHYAIGKTDSIVDNEKEGSNKTPTLMLERTDRSIREVGRKMSKDRSRF